MARSFLNQTILSHLLVAVPPAVVLGLMVMDINDGALREEAQRVHLAVASDLRDLIEGKIERAVGQLGVAERTLDLTEVDITGRQRLLRALVADQHLPYLVLHKKDGKPNTVIGDDSAPALFELPQIPAALRARADTHEYAVDEKEHSLIMAWRRGDEVLGYLAAPLDLEAIRKQAATLAGTYLGARGDLDVVDGHGDYVLSVRRDKRGKAISQGTMFQDIDLNGKGGITSLAVGKSSEFTDQKGQPRLSAVVSSPAVGWLVGTSRPVSDALASLRKVRLRVVLTAVIAALLAGIAGLLIARRISRPVQSLVTEVRRSARRGFDPTARIRAPGELGQLADAFNGAVRELQEHRIELQRTTQVRLRMARMATGSTLHELMASVTSDMEPPEDKEMVVIWADVYRERGEHTQDLPTDNLVTVLGEFFSAAHEAVMASGGQIDRFSGDAVVGIFPSKDERSVRAALRAADEIVRAARAIGERWSEEDGEFPLAASAVVVTGQGSLSRSSQDGAEITAFGSVLERASVLFSSVGPDMVLVDQGVRAAADSRWRFSTHPGTREPTFVADSSESLS